jgi:hypothetical protein
MALERAAANGKATSAEETSRSMLRIFSIEWLWWAWEVACGHGGEDAGSGDDVLFGSGFDEVAARGAVCISCVAVRVSQHLSFPFQ